MTTAAPIIDAHTEHGEYVQTNVCTRHNPDGSEDIVRDVEEKYSIVTKKHFKTPVQKSNGKQPTVYANITQSAPVTGRFTWTDDSAVAPDGTSWHYFGSVIRNYLPGSCALLHTTSGGGMALNEPSFRNRIITEAYAKLNDKKVDFGVALAEATKTANTVLSLADDFARAMIAIKKGDLTTLASVFGASSKKLGKPKTSLSERWLQYQYGIKPLVSDLAGMCELHNQTLENGKGKFIQAKRSLTETTPEVEDIIDSSYIFRSKATIGGTVRLRAKVSDEDLRQLTINGLTDYKAIVWELVPWSFVVDWAFPIGTFLAAKEATAGLQMEHAILSLKGSCKGTLKLRDEIPYGVDCYQITGCETCDYDASGFSREYITENQILPYFKNPLSLGHATNFAALIQARRR